ncbi:UNVERIFIED_CONTAM: Calmodulin-binding protein 60 A [Sesamum calycinum]|uniref:Calmodulin-binding protein 60 A n=1 Tax=Sesamum calycinum TaxID=2727403 RepID=A0AAW2PMR2_9LAMI
MSQKRQQQEEGTPPLDDKRSRKSPCFSSTVLDVMTLQRLQNLVNPVLEPLIRRVVKEEMDLALRKYIISMKRNCGKDIQPPESRSLKLQFSNAISLPVFTGTRIEGEGCTSMEVALVDIPTGQVVSSGLGSSCKILGTGMSAKKWKTTVEHARTCVLDKTLYLYNSPMSLQKNSVVFNVVGQVTGMFLNSQYVPTDKLSEEEKVNAQELVISAFGDREKIVTLAELSLNMPSSCSPDAQTSSNLLPEGSCHQDSTSQCSYLQQDPSSLNFMQSFNTVGGSTSFDYYLHGDDAMEIRYDQPLSFPCQVADSFISDPEPMLNHSVITSI